MDSIQFCIRAGDSFSANYSDETRTPANGWSAELVFVSAAGRTVLPSDPLSSERFEFAMTPTATGLLSPGEYSAVVRLLRDAGSQVHTVASGTVSVLPDLSAGTPADMRSAARRALDAINAKLAGRSEFDSVEIDSGSGRRAIKYLPVDQLLSLRDYFAAQVAREQAAEDRKTGRASRNIVYIGFRGVQ